MSFEVCLWKAVVAPSAAEARDTFEALLQGDPSGLMESPNVAAFRDDLAGRFPSLESPDTDPGQEGFEFAVDDWHAWLSIPWVAVDRVGPVVESLARRHDLILYDPQAAEVYLPPSLGATRAIDWAAIAGLGLALIDNFTTTLEATEPTGNVQVDLEAAMRRLIEESGVSLSRPDGLMVGKENLDQTGLLFRVEGPPFAEPMPVDPRRQTPTALVARRRELRSKDVGTRNFALIQLGGWRPTQEVIDAARAALEDSDPCVRGYAVHALGHLGDVASTERLVEIALELAAEPARDWHGIDMAAEGAVNAVHGCALLRPSSREAGRLLAALPNLRPTGAYFEEQVASIRIDLE